MMRASRCRCCCCHRLVSAALLLALSGQLSSLLLLLLLPDRAAAHVPFQSSQGTPLTPSQPPPPPRASGTAFPAGPGLLGLPSSGRTVSPSGQAGISGNGSGPAAGPAGVGGGGLAVSPNSGDKPMTQRALLVLMAVSAAVLVYFVIRTIRMRRRNRKTRRYGVLDTNLENMELTPLEQDDDDDDTTLFDANHPRR
ncbi:membrane protein FAM174A isoform X2 [Dromiciops gliroides]|uniref:membrane protein FAM174A isoform X1 n=1 Tax=Dromiciops gliroides TaxID=33562 RepID=UPI001CC5AF8E|nr:membrane protein FAM174A isoform X1 [Dromiciops gliroides]XP_043835594.1 membrane protein FAM174A isoform X2 [Dromiciops gliroides]